MCLALFGCNMSTAIYLSNLSLHKPSRIVCKRLLYLSMCPLTSSLHRVGIFRKHGQPPIFTSGYWLINLYVFSICKCLTRLLQTKPMVYVLLPYNHRTTYYMYRDTYIETHISPESILTLQQSLWRANKLVERFVKCGWTKIFSRQCKQKVTGKRGIDLLDIPKNRGLWHG